MRRKTLSLSAATLLIWAASSSAATVDDLKVCKHSYVLVADDYTNNGTGTRTKGELFGDGYFLDVTGGSIATNKGKSNPQELLADGETYRYGEAFAQKYANYGEHLNSLRIKNAQDVIAMKVTAGSKLVFLAQGNDKTGAEARIPKIATDAGMTNVLNDAPTADFITANGETSCSAGYMYEWTATADNTIYIGSYNGDAFIGYIMVEVPETTGTPTVNVGAQTYDATEGLWYREVTCTPATVYGTTTVCTYTTDGTDANASSTLYTGPIKCYKDMTIKFQAYLGEATESKKVANGDNVADVSFKFDAPTIAVDGATFTIENETAGVKNYYSYGNIADLQGDGTTLTTSATVTAYSKIQNGEYATFTTKSVSADVLVLDPIKSDMKIGVTGTAAVDYEAIDYTVYTTNDAAITGANDKYFFFKNTEFGLLANADANLNQYQVPTGQEVYLKMSTTNITFIVAEGDSVDVKVTCSKNSCKDLNGEVTLSDGVVINNPRQCYVNVDGELYGGEDLKENPDGNVITFGLGQGVHTFQKYSGTGNVLISSIEIKYVGYNPGQEEPETEEIADNSAPSQIRKMWDFTKGLSDETVANLNADATNWASNGTDENQVTNNWMNNGKLGGTVQLKANDVIIAETEGLYFNIGSNGSNSIHLSQSNLRLTRNNSTITFPKLANGQTLTVRARSVNAIATNRGFAANSSNLQYISGPDGGICLGYQAEGASADEDGYYTLVWQVVTDSPDSVEVSIKCLTGGLDISLIMINNGGEPETEEFADNTAPVVTGIPLSEAVGQNVYLYNVGMKTFLTGSNYWGTRAAAFTNGVKTEGNNISEAEAAVGFLDGTVSVDGYLWTLAPEGSGIYSLANKTTYGYLTADNADGIWVDGGTDRPYNGWQIATTGNGNGVKLSYNTYPGYYYGFAKVNGTLNTSTWLMSQDNTTTYTDKMEEWLFVSADEYNAVIADLNAYHTRQSLLDYIQTVETAYSGIDLTDIKASANNAETTVAQMQELYSEDIMSAVKNYMASHVGYVPVGSDFTQFLVNPDFSSGTLGWTFESAGMGSTAADASAKCAEAWRKSSFDIYQTVENAPVGVYEISVQGFYREGRDYGAWSLYFDEEGHKRQILPESKAYVYLNDNKTPLANVFDYQKEYGQLYTATGSLAAYVDPIYAYWYPNCMTDAGLAFDQGAYKVSAFGLVAKEGDALRIGAKGDCSAQNDSWAIFTRFALTYQGFKADIIQPELEKAVASMNTTSVMGSDVRTKAENLVSAASLVDPTDGETMFNLLAEIYAVNNEIEESVALFERMSLAVTSFNYALSGSVADAATRTEARNLRDAVEYASINGTYTDAQAIEAIEKMSVLRVKLAIPANAANATDADPCDVTAVLQTPSFVDEYENPSTEGWTIEAGDTGTESANYSGYEFWNRDFDIYQEIKGLPAGTYGIGVKAFSRDGSLDEDVADYLAGGYGLARLYAQVEGFAADTSLQHCASAENNFDEDPWIGSTLSWVDNSGTYYYAPNNMNAAQFYFGENKFKNELYIKIAEGETLRVGVKCENHIYQQWIMMDDFTLTYYGTQSCHIPAPYEAPAVVESLAYTGEAQTLISAGSSAGGEMQYSLDGETFTTTLPALTNAGTHTVYYRVVGDERHGNVAAQSVDVTIDRAEITSVTAPSANTLTYNGEAQTLVEVGSANGGTMQYSLTGKTSSYSTVLPTGTNAGDYIVYYRVVGDANHYDVAAQSMNVTINRAEITSVTAPSANTLTYNGEAQALVAAGSANGGEMLYSLTGKTLTYYPVLPTGTNAKTYTVYYKVVADENHLDVEAQTLTVTIARAEITDVTAPSAIENLAYTGEPQTLISAGSATGGEMQYSLNGEIYSTTAPSATKAGNYEVYYKVVADENHLDVEAQTVAVNISKVAISEITAPSAIEGLIYTSEPLDLANAGSAVGGEMQYSLDGENFSTEVPSATNAETYTVYYRIAGDENHFDVDAASFTVTIQAIDLQIAAGEFITFYSDKKLAADVADVKLYTVTAVTDDAVVIKQLDVADAQTPLLIYNGTEQSTVRLRLSSDEATTYETGSGYTFAGTLVDKAMPGSSETTDYYVCTGKNFVWVKDAGTVAAHNCWLEIAGASNAALSRKIVVESEEVLDVISLKSDNGADDAIYDILGRRIGNDAAAKGMTVRRNKIVINKK